jgi:hypothetical protein
MPTSAQAEAAARDLLCGEAIIDDLMNAHLYGSVEAPARRG